MTDAPSCRATVTAGVAVSMASKSTQTAYGSADGGTASVRRPGLPVRCCYRHRVSTGTT
ncbi:protein of unknown function [Streptomyces sp. KY70]|nr:protein of unknown function [Streptomyces sp. KY70]